MKHRIGNIPIFPKLIITFLIITMPVFTLSLVLNELGKQEVKSQISNSITTTVHYYFLLLEKELERIIRSQQEFINDEDLMQLSNSISIMSEYRKTKAMNDLQLKLKMLKDSSVYIKDINVYIKSINGTVSTSNEVDASSAQEEAETIAQATYTSGIPITLWHNRLYLNLTYPIHMNKGATTSSPQFIQNIELSIEDLKNTLNAFPHSGGAILFTDNWAIANDQYPVPLQELKEKLDDQMQTSFTKQIQLHQEKYMVVYEKSSFLDAALLFYFPENVIVGQLKTYGLWFWLLVGSSFVMVILFSYGIYLLIHRPLKTLISRFKSVEVGNFNPALTLIRQDEFGYIINRFERTVLSVRTLIDELYVQKIRLQQSELKQLQMQITPHFLYNSFFILHRLIKNDENDTAELMSKNLGDYFHYITRNGLEEVSLEEEVNHARSYVEIQSIRFSNRIQVDFEQLPASFRDIMVPRLILQPLVENAYEHGLGEMVTGGRLVIGFAEDMDRRYVTVEDNGTGVTDEQRESLIRRLGLEEEGETTGLINIHRRLTLKYGEHGGLEILQSDLGGLLVRIYMTKDRGE